MRAVLTLACRSVATAELPSPPRAPADAPSPEMLYHSVYHPARQAERALFALDTRVGLKQGTTSRDALPGAEGAYTAPLGLLPDAVWAGRAADGAAFAPWRLFGLGRGCHQRLQQLARAASCAAEALVSAADGERGKRLC